MPGTRRFSPDATLLMRMRAQRLAGPPATDVPAAVRSVGAVPAQDTRAARLAVRPRSTGMDAGAVRSACDVERTVFRTWAMRGTLHMLDAGDVAWVRDLVGPVFAARGRPRRLRLGLDDDLCRRAQDVMAEVLADGPLVRAELVRRLAAEGVAIDPDTQAPAHLVTFAALQGVVCRGPDTGEDEPTYVLLEDWLGPQRPPQPDDALAELTRRYVAAHGPAGAGDLAAWSGLGLRAARRGLALAAGGLEEVEAAGEPAWVVRGAKAPQPRQDAAPCVRLLGHFDPYLLGYRTRDLALAPRHARRIQAGGGFIQPSVVVDGRVVGTWRQQRSAGGLTVSVEPFERLPRGAMAGLEAEAADVGRYVRAEPVSLDLER